MFLGLTDAKQEKTRIGIFKKTRIATTFFLVAVFMPFLLYGLFYFHIVKGKPAFETELQEPVAKVLTQNSVGTAFLISPTLLLTARHVVENNKVGDEVDLIFEQSKNKYQTKAKIKFISPTSIKPVNGIVPLDYFLTDVAVLEVTTINDIEPLIIGESDGINNLDEVILIGYPGGDYSITKGSINSDKFQALNLFKLDAASNPGNSGGPCILSSDKTVIGILVGENASAMQGENVALKINDIKKILLDNKIIIK